MGDHGRCGRRLVPRVASGVHVVIAVVSVQNAEQAVALHGLLLGVAVPSDTHHATPLTDVAQYETARFFDTPPRRTLPCCGLPRAVRASAWRSDNPVRVWPQPPATSKASVRGVRSRPTPAACRRLASPKLDPVAARQAPANAGRSAGTPRDTPEATRPGRSAASRGLSSAALPLALNRGLPRHERRSAPHNRGRSATHTTRSTAASSAE